MHPVQSLGEEIIMERELLLAVLRIGEDFDLGEGRITDSYIEEVFGEFLFGVVGLQDMLLRVEIPGDLGGQMIHLHAGIAGDGMELVGHGPQEVTGTHSRLQDRTAGKTQTLHGAPDTPHDRFTGVMGILGGFDQGPQLFIGELQIFQPLHRSLPFGLGPGGVNLALLRIAGEESVGYFGSAETGILDKKFLFRNGSGTTLLVKLLDQGDNIKVALSGFRPRAGTS